jgi:hypothetical protein
MSTESMVIKMIGNISSILLLTKNNVVFANEVQAFDFYNYELLHYLLFDLVFIISVWLLLYLCKIALTHSKLKMTNTFRFIINITQNRHQKTVKHQ